MKTTATWSISLDCDCPECGEYVDLLDYPDFWEMTGVDPVEHGTDDTRNLEVICPKCRAEFLVDCEY